MFFVCNFILSKIKLLFTFIKDFLYFLIEFTILAILTFLSFLQQIKRSLQKLNIKIFYKLSNKSRIHFKEIALPKQKKRFKKINS